MAALIFLSSSGSLARWLISFTFPRISSQVGPFFGVNDTMHLSVTCSLDVGQPIAPGQGRRVGQPVKVTPFWDYLAFPQPGRSQVFSVPAAASNVFGKLPLARSCFAPRKRAVCLISRSFDQSSGFPQATAGER